MQSAAFGARPQTQSRDAYERPVHGAYATHTGHFERKQHAHWRNAAHTVQATGSTCDYNVYNYHNQHPREYAGSKYDVYTKYSGYAPGAAGAWQQPEHDSAYGSYACYNQSQYAKHDAGAWLQTLLTEHGQRNAHDEQAAFGGEYTEHDACAWLQTLLTEYGQRSAHDEQAASGCLYYTDEQHKGTKRLIDTLATVGGSQGDGGSAGTSHKNVKMRKLYDPGNIQPLDDYDADDWAME